MVGQIDITRCRQNRAQNNAKKNDIRQDCDELITATAIVKAQ